MGCLPEAEWRAIVKRARADSDIMSRVANDYPDLDAAGRTEEAAAELYRLWRADQDSMGALGKVFRRIKDFLEAIASALSGEGFLSAAIVFRKIADGKIGRDLPPRDPNGQFTQSVEKAMRPEVEQAVNRINAKWQAALRAVIANPRRGFPEIVVGSVGPVLKGIGIPAGTIYMASSKIRLVIDQHPEVSNILPRLPELLVIPDAVIAQKRDDSDFRIITSARSANGRPIIAKIKINGETSSKKPGRFIMTIYGWDDAERAITNGNRAGTLVYVKGLVTARRLGLKGDDPLKINAASVRSGDKSKILTLADFIKTDRSEKSRRFSPLVTAAGAKLSSLDAKRVSQAITDAMGGKTGLLSLVPGRALFAELGKKLPSAATYLRLKEDMDAERGDWHARTDAIAQEWRRIKSGNADANVAMMDLMHDATLAELDPSTPFAPKATPQDDQILGTHRPSSYAYEAAAKRRADDIQRKIKWKALKRRFDKLPEEFRETFGKVRDTYSLVSSSVEDAVVANVEKAMVLGMERAKDRLNADLEQIRDDGLTGKERMEAEQEAQARYADAKRRQGWRRGSRLASLRQRFESNRVEGPYFPLSRFGQYFAKRKPARCCRSRSSRQPGISRHLSRSSSP